MAQKYSNNEIRNLGEDWGRDTRDEKYRPFSNGAVQRFIKRQFQEQINGLEDKIGWLRFEGGRIVMYNTQDGTPIGSIMLSGTIYAIKGNIQKIGSGIFLCTPNNINVQGKITDDSDKAKEKKEEEENINYEW